MDDAAPPVDEREDALPSPWWMRCVGLVMVLGFTGLISITVLAYRNAPPIPARCVDAAGATVFTADDVASGQEVFLRHGLMSNGSVWGHGAYLGPDFAAESLHLLGLETASWLAREHGGASGATSTPLELAALNAQVAVMLKTNRHDPVSNTLVLTAPEVAAFEASVAHWTGYFHHPRNNGGLKPDAVSDPTELRQFSAFITWAAWASVANRPGDTVSYTNNFPFDPQVGNLPTADAVLWSALSLLFLLGGIGAVLLASGTAGFLGWNLQHRPARVWLVPGEASAGQRGLLKFMVVVAVLFLMQAVVGGGVAHARADPGNFYGLQLEDLLPSNLLRTWHLQTAIFWIATAYVAAALFLARGLGREEPRWFAPGVHVLFAAFVLVILSSLLGECLGMRGLLGAAWFWLGNQGWEFLELGRFWQCLLVAGLLGWFGMLVFLVRPRRLANPNALPLVRMFLCASLAVPVFYLPALFFGAKTHLTVVETWRFWIIHLWVEGFFEFFATTVVALLFFQLGLTHRNTALRLIYLDAILYFAGGLMGTGHHWYFSGHSRFNMALSAMFSALEVVPLTLLTLDAWDFVRTTRSRKDAGGNPQSIPHVWTFHFLIAVGFWNFVGAGLFGFLINLPIVSYFEAGTMLTPNHGHAALMGVFGMLALAMLVFVLRQTATDAQWAGLEKYVRLGFWGTNVGLLMMVLLSLFPGGVLQLWDVMQHGYWHARSEAFNRSKTSHLLAWMRLPGDVVFILLGAVPLCVAAIKGWMGQRRAPG